MIYPLLLIVINIVVFYPLKDIFFMQDRWLVIGKIVSIGSGYLFLDFPGVVKTLIGEGRFLARVITYLLMINPFNSTPNNIYSIVVHTINVLLSYKLFKYLTKNNKISFWSALFFGLSGVSFSAVIWPAASVVTLTSTTLILISLIYFFKFIYEKKDRYIIYCFLSLFISLQFKEIGMLLFLIYPLGLLIFKRVKLKNLIKKFWLPTILLVSAIVYRLTHYLNLEKVATLFVRLIYYPFLSLSQTLVPAQYLIPVSRRLTNIFLPSYKGADYLLIAETVILDWVSAILSIAVLIVVIHVYKKSKLKNKNELLFFLIFTLSSFVPYILVKKSFSYLDSRYYYLGILGMAFVLSKILTFYKIHKKAVLFFMLLLLLVPHVLTLRHEIEAQIEVSKQREEFIKSFESITKNFSKKEKTVFYVTGDTDYYLLGHKVPFQAGMGYILMVLSKNFIDLPTEFLTTGYLFEIGSQGYREIEGFGFGYFSDLEKLNEEVDSGSFEYDDVVKLYYDSKKKKLYYNNPISLRAFE